MNKKIILLSSIVIAILLVFVFFRLGESNSPSAPQLQIMESPVNYWPVSVLLELSRYRKAHRH